MINNILHLAIGVQSGHLVSLNNIAASQNVWNVWKGIAAWVPWVTRGVPRGVGSGVWPPAAAVWGLGCGLQWDSRMGPMGHQRGPSVGWESGVRLPAAEMLGRG